MTDPLTWSINLGQWGGTRVRVHVLFVLFAVRVLEELRGGAGGSDGMPLAAFAGFVILSVGLLFLAAVHFTLVFASDHGFEAAAQAFNVFDNNDFFILAGQGIWAIYSVYARQVARRFPPVVITAGTYIVAAAFLVPLSLIERPWTAIPHMTLGTTLALGVGQLGVLGQGGRQ